MSTDELIERLAAEAAPVEERAVERRLLAAGALGAVGAAALMVAWLHVRPDLAEALQTARFWIKFGYGLVLALAGYLMIERMSRPAGRGSRGLALALGALAVLLVLGGGELMMASPEARMPIWLGKSWRHCPFNILTLAGPMLVIALFTVRTLAPTRLARAGAATGLFSAGVAMAVYCLHCPETEPAFVMTWYTAGALLTTAVGAVVGWVALRWR